MVTFTLIIVGIVGVFVSNVSRFTEGLEQSVRISVLVDYDYESASEEDRISLAISEIDGVDKVTYVSKEEELEYYLNSFEDEKLKEVFAPFKDDNPMHEAFYVDVSDGTKLESIAETIKGIEGVAEVDFGGSSATKLVSTVRSVRLFGEFAALVLSALAVLLIQSTIKLTINARVDEIAIMRNVGAKNGFIRAPFVIEGMMIGAFGAIIPMLIIYFGYKYIYNLTGGYILAKMFTLIPPQPYLTQVCLLILFMGMFVGLIGSFISVTRYLRWKR